MASSSGEFPLTGWRVLVPRDGDWGSRAAELLSERGAEPVVAPVIRTAPPLDDSALADAIRRLEEGSYDWAFFTSAAAAGVLGERNAIVAEGTRIAVVGEATARAVEAAGYAVDFAPTGEASAAALAAQWNAAHAAAPMRVLVLRSDLAKPVVSDALTAAGHSVDVCIAYRTMPVELAPGIVADAREGRIDAVLITSGSVANEVAAQLGPLPEGLVLASIGPGTTADAQALGLRIDVTASYQGTEILIGELAEFARNRHTEGNPPRS